MSLVRSGGVLVLLIVGFGVAGHAQEAKSFPTDDEINPLLIQTDRAMQQYKIVINLEEAQLGKGSAEAVARDRQVVSALEIAVKVLRSQPQGFNGPAGFALVEWLDDADRNALLCASGASNQSTLHFIAGETDRANDLIHLSQSCMDISTLIYTVSENAAALFRRHVEAEQKLATKGLEAAQKCMEVLKEKGLVPKK